MSLKAKVTWGQKNESDMVHGSLLGTRGISNDIHMRHWHFLKSICDMRIIR